MPSVLENAVSRFRGRLLAGDAAALARMKAAYDPVADLLVDRIAELERALAEKGELTAAEAVRLERAKTLLRDVEDELARLADDAERFLTVAQRAAVQEATTAIVGLAEAQSPGIAASFNRVPTEAVTDLVGRLGDGSPLRTWLDQWGQETGDKMAAALRDGVALGRSPRDVAAALRKQVDVAEWRLLQTTRTSMLGAYRGAAHESYKRNQDILEPEWEWVSTKSSDTCGACLALDGQRFPISEGFQKAHVSCFPAGTLVFGPPVLGSSRRWYSGDIVEIETEGGRRVSVTPNHPILTTKGWVPAGLLNEGSDLICGGIGEGAPGINGDRDDVPPLIEEVARTLRRSALVMTTRVPGAAEDFHGDGRRGEVSVVRTDGKLGRGFDAAFAQHPLQFPFGFRDVEFSNLPGSGALASLFKRCDASSHRVMGSLRESLSIFGTGLTHSQVHALATAARDNPRFSNPGADHRTDRVIGSGQRLLRLSGLVPRDDFSIGKPGFGASSRSALGASQRVPLCVGSQETAIPEGADQPTGSEASDALADSLSTFAGDITTDRVFKLFGRTFAGHVYNLETSDGWYLANGIIAHNCRCSSIPIVKGVAPPDRQLGSDWLAEQDAATQDGILGKTGGAEYRAGNLAIGDFVALDKNPTWGDSYRAATLGEARMNRGRNAA